MLRKANKVNKDLITDRISQLFPKKKVSLYTVFYNILNHYIV